MPRKKAAPRATENNVEAGATDFWEVTGWTVLRNHVGVFRSLDGHRVIRLGTAGMTDYLALKPCGGRVLAVWTEIKRPGEKPRADQLEWMAARRNEGFEAQWFDDAAVLAKWFGLLEHRSRRGTA